MDYNSKFRDFVGSKKNKKLKAEIREKADKRQRECLTSQLYASEIPLCNRNREAAYGFTSTRDATISFTPRVSVSRNRECMLCSVR